MLAEVEADVATQKVKVDEQLAKNSASLGERQAQIDEIKASIVDLKEQVAGVQSGEQLQKCLAMLTSCALQPTRTVLTVA